MFTRWATGTVVLLAIGTAATFCSPALRAHVNGYWASFGGWNEDARRADPVGFTKYASGKLQSDLDVMQRTRRELPAELGQLSGKFRNQQAFRDQAQQLAEEFRGKYQTALENGSFPIQVRSAAYTQQQAKSQVSMILAELSGHEAATTRLEKVKKQAETQLEALAMRINASESQLAALSIQKEMLRAQQLSDDGEKLLAQVDQLLDDNSRALEENPVRTVRELLGASENTTGKRANEEVVDAFLAQKVPVTPQVVVVAKPIVSSNEQKIGSDNAKKPAVETDAARTIKVEKTEKTDSIPKIMVTVPNQPVQQQNLVQEQSTSKNAKPIFQQF